MAALEQQNQSEPADDDGMLPPPEHHREDKALRVAISSSRHELDNASGEFNEPSFSKGDNSATFNETGLPYTIEEMDQQRYGPPAHFPDAPGGAGATPISAKRDTFLDHMLHYGHFGSRTEAQQWARAVFNALRQHALEVDDTGVVTNELGSVIRVGESPEVQVEEMMWGGEFTSRWQTLLMYLRDWSKHDFYREIAKEANNTADDPWVEDAVYSVFSAYKQVAGDQANFDPANLGELSSVWQRV